MAKCNFIAAALSVEVLFNHAARTNADANHDWAPSSSPHTAALCMLYRGAPDQNALRSLVNDHAAQGAQHPVVTFFVVTL